MKLSVCIDAVYAGIAPEEAIRQVKKQGISAVEFWNWEKKNLTAIEHVKKEMGVEIAAFCTGFISLVDGSMREQYLASLRRTIEAAQKLGCRTIISQVGNELPLSRREQSENLIEGLRACVPYLEEAGMMLVIEPLNTRVDHAGYFLSGSDEGVEIIKAVGSRHVKLLYDIYHQQITEGDLIRRIREQIDYIGHFHAAGNPGRHELYHSEIDYRRVLDAIRETGYDGYIGLEYFPQEEPQKGLRYAKELIEK